MVHLRTLQSKQSKDVSDLDEEGFGGHPLGLTFTSLHGYAITEIFHDQTKRHAGPHAAGFTTDIDTKSMTSYTESS